MPAVAVSGRARVLASWLSLVERLVVGADDEIGGGVAAIAASRSWRVELRPRRAGQGVVLGRAHRNRPRCRWPPASSPIIRQWATPGGI
jgi:hypothetical protein